MKRENIYKISQTQKKKTGIYYFRRSHISQSTEQQAKKKYKELKMRRIVNSIKTCEKISKYKGD